MRSLCLNWTFLKLSLVYSILCGGCTNNSVSIINKLQPGPLPSTDLAEQLDFVDPRNGWAVTTRARDVRLFRTSDAGALWVCQTTFDTAIHGRISFTTLRSGWLGLWNGTVYHTQDGGWTWKPFEVDTAMKTFQIFELQAINDLDVWIVGQIPVGLTGGGVIYHTTDGGQRWARCYLGYEGSLRSISIVGNDIWAAGGGMSDAVDLPLIVHSSDSGKTWTDQHLEDTYVGPLRKIRFVDHNLGYCGGFGPLRRTTDGGTLWRSELVPCCYDMCLLDGSDVWVAGGGDSLPSAALYHSTNRGIDWSKAWVSDTSVIVSMFFLDGCHGWASGLRFVAGQYNGIPMLVRYDGSSWSPL